MKSAKEKFRRGIEGTKELEDVKMKCPLSNYILEKEDTDNEMLVTDCLKEECAWWDKLEEECTYTLQTKILEGIRVALFDIADKMPHAEHFTK